jgi:hypothetical protein
MSTEILQSLPQSPGVWKQAWLRLKTDRVGMVSLYVTMFFIALVLAALFGLVAKDWNKEVGVPFAAPHPRGKNRRWHPERDRGVCGRAECGHQ